MKTQEAALKTDTGPTGAGPIAPDSEPHRSIAQRVAISAHETIDSAAAKADEIEQQLRVGATKAGNRFDASQEAATAQVEKSLDKLETFVKARPIAAAGIAFAAGVIATALLRR